MSETLVVRLGAATFVVALAAGLVVISAAPVAGGPGAGPAKTIPTLPVNSDVPTSVDDASGSTVGPDPTGPDSSSGTSDSPTTTGVDTGIVLPAGAGITQMFATTTRLFTAETGDLASAFGAFAEIPDGVATPVGSTIQRFTIQYGGVETAYRLDVTFTSAAEAADVAVFYETTLTAAAFVLTADEVGGSGQLRTLRFAVPDSQYDDASVEVSIDSGDNGSIRLVVNDYVDPVVLGAFTGWARGLPTVADGVPTGATLTADRASGPSLTVSTSYAYDDRTAEELTSEIRDAIADGNGGGFRIDDATDEGGGTIVMTHSVMRSPVADVSADDDGGSSLLLTASLTLG